MISISLIFFFIIYCIKQTDKIFRYLLIYRYTPGDLDTRKRIGTREIHFSIETTEYLP
jgi:hypothetical protein